MTVHIWVRGSNAADGLCVEVERDFLPVLTKALRESKAPLTKERMAKMLGGKCGSVPKVTGTIAVKSWSCLFTRAGETTFLRGGTAPLPGMNAIKDFRQKPKPYTVGGACTG